MESTFASRLRAAAEAKAFTRAELARESGVNPKRVSEYWSGPKSATSDNLFPLARALSVSAEWLALGSGPRTLALTGVEDVEIVPVPEYDLRHLDEAGRGEPIATVPMRRDWLARTFGNLKGIWLASSRWSYDAEGIGEGAPLILRDVERGELDHRQLCLFRSHGHLLLARFSAVVEDGVFFAGDRVGETYISAAQLDDPDIHPVARVLGVTVQPL